MGHPVEKRIDFIVLLFYDFGFLLSRACFALQPVYFLNQLIALHNIVSARVDYLFFVSRVLFEILQSRQMLTLFTSREVKIIIRLEPYELNVVLLGNL